jgi:iron complex outermembrane receptor protein
MKRITSRFGTSHVGCALLAAVAVWVAPASAIAQDGAVAGTIRAAGTSTGLSTVQIEVLGAGQAVIASGLSGSSGAFRLTGIPAGNYTLVFSSPGWEQTVETITVTAGQTASVAVEMSEQVFNLNPITVTASKTEEKVLEAPAAVEVVPTVDLAEIPALTWADQVKSVSAVDVIRTGLQQNYVVVRGFNNIFSGATLTLTDNRIARVPSLRANVTHLNPTTNADMERIEVVLGPGSALYGPNAANGVIHTITKSPIDYPGGTLSVAGGLRHQGAVPGQPETTAEGLGHIEGRYGWRASDKFGVKLSGLYFTGEDYFFADPVEVEQQGLALECQEAGYSPTSASCLNFANGLDLSSPDDVQTLRSSVDNVAGGRNNTLERWAADARADWRPTEDWNIIFAGGQTKAVSSVDLTGLGGAQAVNWAYTYLQARAQYKNAFAQVFWNKSDNSESYLFRSGRPLLDKSSLFVTQLQNASQLGNSHRLIYGVDYLRTEPRTEGTINGQNEDDDDINEVGGYVQWEWQAARQWELVGAARVDKHSRLDDPVFSPRAAVVYRPNQENTFRATYNRAFSTPTTLNLFLDISGGTIPLGGPFQYDVRAQGSTGDGLQFRRMNGIPDGRSPFSPLRGQDPQAWVPTSTGSLWDLAVRVVSLSDPQLGAFLATLPPPGDDDVRIDSRTVNPTAAPGQDPFFLTPGVCNSRDEAGQPVCDLTAIDDLPVLNPTITNTFELGYKGLIGDRFLLSANAYYTRIKDFTSALQVSTPHAFLNPFDIEMYLRGLGLPAPQARAIGVAIGGDPDDASEVGIPLSVLTYENAGGAIPSAHLTYQNLGDVDLFGADLSATYVAGTNWELGATVAFVSDDTFDTGTELVPLNAPTFKTGWTVRFRDEASGFNAGALFRTQNGFPANSGVYVGEVDGYGTLDMNFGYRFPGARPVSVQLGLQNLITLNGTCGLDEDRGIPKSSCGMFSRMYQSFVGAPLLGRYGMLRLVWEF